MTEMTEEPANASEARIGRVLIGTSGWSYGHWIGDFYPPEAKPGQLLAEYCRRFDTVEINASFYRLPLVPMLIGLWQTSPAHFVFSVKASKYITHRLKLRDAADPLGTFIRRMMLLYPKLGPVLFQLSPGFSCDLEVLARFMEALPEGLRYTFEFRHQSWFCDEVYALLKERDCALTIADTPRYPLVFEVTAGFVYCRLHGSRALYRSCYTEEELQSWAGRIREWSAEGRDVYVYFDNDFHAHAPRNALRLREILEDQLSTRDVPPIRPN